MQSIQCLGIFDRVLGPIMQTSPIVRNESGVLYFLQNIIIEKRMLLMCQWPNNVKVIISVIFLVAFS